MQAAWEVLQLFNIILTPGSSQIEAPHQGTHPHGILATVLSVRRDGMEANTFIELKSPPVMQRFMQEVEQQRNIPIGYSPNVPFVQKIAGKVSCFALKYAFC